MTSTAPQMQTPVSDNDRRIHLMQKWNEVRTEIGDDWVLALICFIVFIGLIPIIAIAFIAINIYDGIKTIRNIPRSIARAIVARRVSSRNC